MLRISIFLYVNIEIIIKRNGIVYFMMLGEAANCKILMIILNIGIFLNY